jgi:hypothetical protein
VYPVAASSPDSFLPLPCPEHTCSTVPQAPHPPDTLVSALLGAVFRCSDLSDRVRNAASVGVFGSLLCSA